MASWKTEVTGGEEASHIIHHSAMTGGQKAKEWMNRNEEERGKAVTWKQSGEVWSG